MMRLAAFLPYLGRTGRNSTKDLERRLEMDLNPKTDWVDGLRDDETE